jgi:NAD(P)-dependent dehydrogenase (short-subunit alcohol dehydrogenase family)
MTAQSNVDKLITIFGGSGFLGRHVVQALAKQRYRIRVAVRRPDRAGHLQPLGCVGQIHAVQANVLHPASVAAAVRGSDVVINLVGILFESGRQRFDSVHSFGAEGARGQGPQVLKHRALGKRYGAGFERADKGVAGGARPTSPGPGALRGSHPTAAPVRDCGAINSGSRAMPAAIRRASSHVRKTRFCKSFWELFSPARPLDECCKCRRLSGISRRKAERAASME